MINSIALDVYESYQALVKKIPAKRKKRVAPWHLWLFDIVEGIIGAVAKEHFWFHWHRSTRYNLHKWAELES